MFIDCRISPFALFAISSSDSFSDGEDHDAASIFKNELYGPESKIDPDNFIEKIK